MLFWGKCSLLIAVFRYTALSVVSKAIEGMPLMRRKIKKEEEKMPKLKTKSSAKKRFKVTKNGAVLAGQAGKRHNMRKRSNRQIRDQRGTAVLPDVEAKRIKHFMPYDR